MPARSLKISDLLKTYPKEQVEDAVALLLLQAKSRAEGRPPEAVLALLEAFARRVGVTHEGANVQEAFDRYFAQHPPNRELLEKLQGALSE